MEKLSVKERINIYNKIINARKGFFKKLRQHDVGEVSIQDIQMKALEPVTGKLEEVRKQAQEIYVEIQEYFRLNRMDEEIAEMKNIYEEIQNVNEKLAFVKKVLEDIVKKEDVDFDEAKDEAKEEVKTTSVEGEEGTAVEGESKSAPPVTSVEGEEGEDKKTSIKTTRRQERFEDLFIPFGTEGSLKITKKDVEGLKIGQLKNLVTARYPNLKNAGVQTALLNKYKMKNINDLRNLLVENLSKREMVDFARGSDIAYIKKYREIEEGKEGVAVTTSGSGLKRKRGRPRKKRDNVNLQQTPITKSELVRLARQTNSIKMQKGKGHTDEQTHLVNSLVLHTGSKAAGNDNLDSDIKKIINRMHKNKMITAVQKKELLNKYI